MYSANDVLDMIEKRGELGSSSGGREFQPFELTPKDYIHFANNDMKSPKRPGAIVNAVGNIKRAVDCQVDTLLDYWCLRKGRLPFPSKMALLNEVHPIALPILGKINTYRNSVEHNYTKPNLDEAKDFYDVAQLFIAATKWLLAEGIESDCDFTWRVKKKLNRCNIRLYRPSKEIFLDFIPGEPVSIRFKLLSSDRENYIRALRIRYGAAEP